MADETHEVRLIRHPEVPVKGYISSNRFIPSAIETTGT